MSTPIHLQEAQKIKYDINADSGGDKGYDHVANIKTCNM